jgi:ABC-2 type transport system permease protein
MLKKIWHLAWNDIKIYFESPSTLIFFLVLPVVFTAVVGAGLRGSYTPPDSSGDNRFPVLVVDQDESDLSSVLLERMAASQVIRPVVRPRSEAERLFEEENVPALLTIPQAFGDRLLAGEPVDLSLQSAEGDSRALAVEQAVSGAAYEVGTATAIAHTSVEEASAIEPFSDGDARQAYFQASLELALERLADPPAMVTVTQAPEATTNLGTSFDQSSAGQLVTWVLITLIGVAEWFLIEREGGTLRRLLVTPTTKGTLLTGKVVGRLLLGLVQMVILVVIGGTVFGVNWGRSPAALAVMLLAFGLAAVGLGTLVGALAKSRGQADGLVTMLSMLLAALGGAWWPLEVTPPAYRVVVKVLPTTWAMMGFKDVIIRGQGVGGILTEAGVLLGFAAVFFVAGLWQFDFE